MNMWSKFALRVLPPVCALCGSRTEGPLEICADCDADLPRIPHPCRSCGVPLPPGAGTCGRCLRRPPAYDALVAPFLYAPPLSGLVTGLKFRKQLRHARLLGELLGRTLAGAGHRPECLLPVPLHPARQRQRGFNQALELARPLADRLQIPLAAASLHRTRATDEQSGLAANRRRANVRDAFAVAGPCPGAYVAIVDDVVTTGHTVEEIARVLRRSGVRRVEVWAVARAVAGKRPVSGPGN